MTISSETRKAGPFTGNDTTDTFPFTFKVFQDSDLLVVRLNVSTGIETTLVLDTDYTVSLNANQNANPGGDVVLSANLATGYKLVITSAVQNLQPVDLTNQGGYYPKVQSEALDRATIQIQQLQEQVDRCPKVSITGSESTETFEESFAHIAYVAAAYLGAAASPPGTRTDGSALQAGDLYFDTTLDVMRVYSGSGWVATGSSVNGTSRRFRYVATAGQTTFTGADVNANTLAYDVGFIDVYLNGIRLDSSEYTASNGTSIVLGSGATLNDELNIVAFGTFDVANIHGSNLQAGTVDVSKLDWPLDKGTAQSIAASATVDLRNTTTEYIQLTNPTTIDNIQIPTGAIRIIKFTASGFVLNGGANLKLPGARSITVGVSDIAVFCGGDTINESTLIGYMALNGKSYVEDIVTSSVLATTSGTAHNFTYIPAWVQRITVKFGGVSLSGTADIVVRLGTSGGVVSSGYLSHATRFQAASSATTNSTTGFIVSGGSPAAGHANYGVLTLEKLGVSGGNHYWVAKGQSSVTATYGTACAGGVALAAALDRIQVTSSNGTDTFDAGVLSVSWE